MELGLPFVGSLHDYASALWDNYIAGPPQPPMPPAISASSVVSSSSVPDIGAQITEQQKAWQASNQGFMNALATQIDANNAVIGTGVNWLLVGGAIVGGLVVTKYFLGGK